MEKSGSEGVAGASGVDLQGRQGGNGNDLVRTVGRGTSPTVGDDDPAQQIAEPRPRVSVGRVGPLGTELAG